MEKLSLNNGRELRDLRVVSAVRAVRGVTVIPPVIAAAHEGYHHSAYDWWIFNARMTSPKTCQLCKVLHLRDYRGDWIPARFPYHTHQKINVIRAQVHRHCRCRLRWAGRGEQIYNSPFGLLTPDEVAKVWKPTAKELEKLTPSQLQYIINFLRSPYRG